MNDDDTPTRRAVPDGHVHRHEPAAGQRLFGRYLLEGVAGRGGMGVVWRARDEELGDTVALKFLPEIVATDAVAVDELKEETRRARRLTHPHIVRIYNFERDETMAAVSMEFVDGATLAQRRLTQPGKVFSTEALAPLVVQLCAALDYAHDEAKVVHRDLKPANLLVTGDGHLKVTDFGIARSLSETHTRLTGRAGGNAGTLLYMSPQQLTGGKPTSADDIYSLGATLYELLCGRPPFYTGDITHQILNKIPTDLTDQRSGVDATLAPLPRPWEKTILQCLDKEAAKRPKSGREILGLLGLGGGSAPTKPAPAGAEGKAKPLSSLHYPTGGKKWEDLEEPVVSSVHYPNPDRNRKARPQTWFDYLVILILLGAGVAYFFGLTPLPRPWIENATVAEPTAPSATAAEPAPAVPGKTAPSLAAKPNVSGTATMANPPAVASPGKNPPTNLAAPESAAMAGLIQTPAASPNTIIPANNVAPEIVPAIPVITGVRLRATPETAQVLLDDSPEPHPVPLKLTGLSPGPHVLTLSAPGYPERKIEFTAERGQTVDLGTVRLVAGVGSLMIDSQPSFIQFELKNDAGGRSYRGVTPWDDNKLSAGSYTLIFVRPGNADAEKKITIEPHALLRVMADFSGGMVNITTRGGAPTQTKPVETVASALAFSVPKTGRLRLDVSGPDAFQLFVDGQATGFVPGDREGIELPPGRELSLELRAPGYQTATRKLTLVAGGSETWKVSLEKTAHEEWNVATPIGQSAPANPTPVSRAEKAVEPGRPIVAPAPARPRGVRQNPRVLQSVQPDYPAAVRAERIQGTVTVRLTILPTGRVGPVEEIASPDPRLTKAVQDAVAQFRFDPAKVDGQPVTQNVTLDFEFRL